MRFEVEPRRIVTGVALGLLLVFVTAAARAQSGSNAFATWSTVRQNGQAITTLSPRPGVPGEPNLTIRPSDVGGLSRTHGAGAGSINFHKPVSIPYSSGVTGLNQTLQATATRTATRAAIVDAALTATKLSSPVGMVILGAGVLGAYFEWQAGDRIKTLLRPEQTTGGTQIPPATQYRYPPAPSWFPSLAEACAGHAAYQQAQQAASCTPGTERAWYTGPSWMTAEAYCINERKTTTTCGASFGSTQNANLGWSFVTQSNGCPTGWTLQNGQCVSPPVTACPQGYEYATDFFYPGFECRPSVGTPPTLTIPPDALTREAVDLTIGQDTGRLDDTFDNLPAPLGAEAPVTNTTGPSSLPQSTTSIPTSDGGRIDKVVTPQVTYNTNVITIGDTVTTTTYNSNNVQIGDTTQTNAPNEQGLDPCGLPSTPPCKIDETGTPTEGSWTQAGATRDAGFQSLEDLAAQVVDNKDTTSWGLGFNPPTSCTNPPSLVMDFAGGKTLTADLCQFESQIHSIMTFIWILFTLYACVTMVREATAG